MEGNIFGIVRDVLVIAYMFVLRIGVPLMITLMIGWWLQRLLEEKEPAAEPQGTSAKGEPHCWEVKKTCDALRAQSAATQRPDLPCWLALQVSGSGLTEACYSCPLFIAHAPAAATVRA